MLNLLDNGFLSGEYFFRKNSMRKRHLGLEEMR
jgi:hypothetical protein